jgi:transcriptional regulator with XRE-family HTH domain
MPGKRRPHPETPSARSAPAAGAPSFTDLAAGWGSRLRLAREAIAPTAKALADAVNISPQRWSHWELERHPPSFDAMLALKHWHGLSLDWIYAGDPSGLRGGLIQRMLAVPAHPRVEPALTLLRASMLAGSTGEPRRTVHEPAGAFKPR